MSEKTTDKKTASKSKIITVTIAAVVLLAAVGAGAFALNKGSIKSEVPIASVNSEDVTVDTNTDTNTSSDVKADTSTQKDQTDTSSRKTQEKESSSLAASSKPTEKKETVSSASSKTESTASSSTSSGTSSSTSSRSSTQPAVTYTTVTQPNEGTAPTTNTTVPDQNSSKSTEEKQSSDTETAPQQNVGYGYVDPVSVGKSIPISYVGTEEKKVSISFDASWGNDNTQSILDTLDRYDVKTTFFLVGIWVRAYPDDVKKIAQAGHDIGNHSNTHPDLTQLSTAGIQYEMETCSADIEALTGQRPTLFRNPYGAYDNRVIGTALGMGMDCIQWDVDTLDWTNNSGDEICARIRSKIRNGSIILMHNAGGSTADSLPMIIETIRGLGYEIVPISELIPDGGYTTDYSGQLIPNDPPVIDTAEDSEEPEDTSQASDQPEQTEVSSESDTDDTDTDTEN